MDTNSFRQSIWRSKICKRIQEIKQFSNRISENINRYLHNNIGNRLIIFK